MELERQNIRLAIRMEGEWVNAYIAAGDTMENAIHIGSVRRILCDNDPEVFQAWGNAMNRAMVDTVEMVSGKAVIQTQQEKAPEHERAGRA